MAQATKPAVKKAAPAPKAKDATKPTVKKAAPAPKAKPAPTAKPKTPPKAKAAKPKKAAKEVKKVDTPQAAKKSFIGIVVSTKNQKTITVAVESYIKHPLYGKRFKKIKKLHAHDEKSEAKLGDKVQVQESRPISKSKTFRFIKVVEKAKDGE